MAALTVDISQLPLATRQRMKEILHREDLAQLALAKARQARMIQAIRTSVGPGTTKQGIGPMSFAIDHYFKSYFRRKHGDQIFGDESFMEWLKRRGEWFHVPEAATRVQSGWKSNRGAQPVRQTAKTSRGERVVRERIVYA